MVWILVGRQSVRARLFICMDCLHNKASWPSSKQIKFSLTNNSLNYRHLQNNLISCLSFLPRTRPSLSCGEHLEQSERAECTWGSVWFSLRSRRERGWGRGARTREKGDWELGTRERLLQSPPFFHFCGRQRPQNSDWLIFDSKPHGNDVIWRGRAVRRLELGCSSQQAGPGSEIGTRARNGS